MNLQDRVVEMSTDLRNHAATVVKGALHDGAQRLRLLSNSHGVKNAYAQQIQYFDITRDRVVRDARQTWEILADASRDVSQLAMQRYAAFVKGVDGTKSATKRPAKASSKKRTRKAA